MANKLGEVADKFDTRDAFHVACVSVLGDGNIKPGDDVKFLNRECNLVAKCSVSERHAIADPFLGRVPVRSEAFWAVLCPDSTANLSHNFDIVIDGVVQRPTAPEPYYEEYSYDECAGCN